MVGGGVGLIFGEGDCGKGVGREVGGGVVGEFLGVGNLLLCVIVFIGGLGGGGLLGKGEGWYGGARF